MRGRGQSNQVQTLRRETRVVDTVEVQEVNNKISFLTVDSNKTPSFKEDKFFVKTSDLGVFQNNDEIISYFLDPKNNADPVIRKYKLLNKEGMDLIETRSLEDLRYDDNITPDVLWDNDPDLDNLPENFEDNLVSFDPASYMCYKINHDKPMTRPYSVIWGSKAFKLDELEKLLADNNECLDIKRYDNPVAQNWDYTGTEHLKATIKIDQDLHDKIVDVENKKSKYGVSPHVFENLFATYLMYSNEKDQEGFDHFELYKNGIIIDKEKRISYNDYGEIEDGDYWD